MEDYTSFQEMYDFFLSGITDDMFMEMTKEDTLDVLEDILIASLAHFEFAQKNINDLDLVRKSFKCQLTLEEKRIIRSYMVVEWLNMQLASIENVRQKYSGPDFSFTSQASHMDKVMKMRDTYLREGYHLQRVYCRHYVDEAGRYRSTMRRIMDVG